MKKIIFLFGLLAVFFVLLISCAKEIPETPVAPENLPTEAVAVGEDAVTDYYSIKIEGFGKYLEAFPTEWRTGLQKTLEYTDEQFAEAVANADGTIDSQLQDEYGDADYYIEYEFKGEREIDEEEYKTLMDELTRFLYMTGSTIEDIKAQTYSVVTYGVDFEGYIVNEQFKEEELYMLYIKDEGWKVSPHEYSLP